VTQHWIAANWSAPAVVVAGTTLRDQEYAYPGNPYRLRQVHGTHAVTTDSHAFDSGPPEADAVIARRPGDICVVRSADCLPVLLCAEDGSEVAAVHAGWRGLAAGVIEATLARMSTPAAGLLAWFGPAISQAAFEVGDEVRTAFLEGDAGARGAFLRNARGRWQADLYRLARRRLRRSGVGRISGGGLCTYADTRRFFSYRRDGPTGRMESFIYIAEA
jgi:purine-nucleoside/S-methyl-5'-thioadenosine phosphorylase / adenosine deaminase